MSCIVQSIYTDGACSGNPGPGGWGTVIYFADGSCHELGGADPQTTNNRMEMQAAIAALEFLAASEQTQPVELYTDSEYLKNGITQWIKGWKKKNWVTSSGKPVLNQDLWAILDELNTRINSSVTVQWRYVRGHAGNVGNERCDTIARAFSLGKPFQLTQKLPSTLTTSEHSSTDVAMTDSPASLSPTDSLEELPREVRVTQLRHLVETLHMADEIASKGYLISSSELADLMDVNASAVTSRGDHWVWRNWVVSRVRREGNQILWQLERVD
ncbi:MAG TPA: ribonuclease HI [Microcoleaceae cyanobacterium]|jgi:ribonuclease HI